MTAVLKHRDQRTRDRDLVAKGAVRFARFFQHERGTYILEPDANLDAKRVFLCQMYNSAKRVKAAIRQLIEEKKWGLLQSALTWDMSKNESVRKFREKRDRYALGILREILNFASETDGKDVIKLIRAIYENSGDRMQNVQTKAMKMLIDVFNKGIEPEARYAFAQLVEMASSPLKCRTFQELETFMKQHIK